MGVGSNAYEYSSTLSLLSPEDLAIFSAISKIDSKILWHNDVLADWSGK